MNYNTVISAIEPPKYKEQLIKKYQNTADIINDLLYCFKYYNTQALPLSKLYRTGNIKTDSRKIYDFIRENIKYNAEPFTSQTTSSFSRIIHDKNGDCKHSALIVGSIGYSMGYNVFFRFVSYDKDKQLGHVYTILQDPKTKEKIIVDPLQSFNYEKPFTKKKDYLAINLNPKNMALTRLTGIKDDSNEIDLINGISLKSLVKKVETTVKRDVQQVKQAVTHPGETVKKIALAPVRGGYDALLFINFRNLATRTNQAILKDPVQMKSFADKFGYSFDIFKSKAAEGAKKKSIGEYDNNRIGVVVATTVAASAAAAAPILAIIVPLLEKINLVKHPTDDLTVKQAVNDIPNLPDASATSPYVKPILITLAAGSVIYFGGKSMGIFGKK